MVRLILVLHPTSPQEELVSRLMKQSECILRFRKIIRWRKKRSRLKIFVMSRLFLYQRNHGRPFISILSYFVKSMDFHLISCRKQQNIKWSLVLSQRESGAIIPTSARRLFNLDVVYRSIEGEQLLAEWTISYRRKS